MARFSFARKKTVWAPVSLISLSAESPKTCRDLVAPALVMVIFLLSPPSDKPHGDMWYIRSIKIYHIINTCTVITIKS